MPPRIRQVVLAARDLDRAAERLRSQLPLGEPFSDPGVGYFGLRNAVFALGDTFLEVVSPVREGTAAGRLLDRRGGDCGYMAMFQVDDLAAARARAGAAGLREVFEVALDDIEEVHLHPADMHAAIVSMSTPKPASAWRWGGPGWEQRSAPLRVADVAVEVADGELVSALWQKVIGTPLPVAFKRGRNRPGLVEVSLTHDDPNLALAPFEICGVHFDWVPDATPAKEVVHE